MANSYPTTFGSISSGTMRAEDLIPCFASELRDQVKAAAPHPGALNPDHVKLIEEAEAVEDFDSEEAGWILDELFDALNEYSPPHGDFGSHPGDGADYGYWLSEDWEQAALDSGAIKVSDLSEMPRGYSGEVLLVNDHGNVTLYSADRGKLTEIWSVV